MGGYAVVLICKRLNAYTDISTPYYRPWRLYNYLRLAKECEVLDKLLFGTDHPVVTAEITMKGLYEICKLSKNTNLSPI